MATVVEMDGAAGTIELALEGSAGYAATVTLLGEVIALHGTRIARERARPRPDRSAIAALEVGRNTAVQVCRTLNSADPATLEEIRDAYARLYLDLLTDTGAAMGRSYRESVDA